MILANHGIISSSGGELIFDTDALAFMTAASITDNTQKTAINTLVTDLKGYNIWTKMKAIYPFVGGSATSHKWNLKDARDLDAAFRLTFNGGWTHSSTGALPNGSNSYADTKFKPNSNLSVQSSAHFSLYSNTNSLPVTNAGKINGCYTIDPVNSFGIGYYTNPSNIKYNYASIGSSIEILNNTNTNTQGFILSSRISNVSLKLYKNSSLIATDSTNLTIDLPNDFIYLGGRKTPSTIDSYSDLSHQFASIGDGLSDTEAANLYTAVQLFNTTLSRQV